MILTTMTCYIFIHATSSTRCNGHADKLTVSFQRSHNTRLFDTFRLQLSILMTTTTFYKHATCPVTRSYVARKCLPMLRALRFKRSDQIWSMIPPVSVWRPGLILTTIYVGAVLLPSNTIPTTRSQCFGGSPTRASRYGRSTFRTPTFLRSRILQVWERQKEL